MSNSIIEIKFSDLKQMDEKPDEKQTLGQKWKRAYDEKQMTDALKWFNIVIGNIEKNSTTKTCFEIDLPNHLDATRIAWLKKEFLDQGMRMEIYCNQTDRDAKIVGISIIYS